MVDDHNDHCDQDPMAGTSVDVTFTILDPPPNKHHPVINARIPPMIHGVHFAS